MRYSFITSVYNKLNLTRKFWDSLRANAPWEPWEMIWVDDGSSDGTREWLATLPKGQCRIINNVNNAGFAASNNAGARMACGEVLCFLNNDLELVKNWIEPLYTSLFASESIGLVGNIQLRKSTGAIDHAGVIFDPIGRPEHFLKDGKLGALRGTGCFFKAATAACWVMRRDTFFDVGGFDERYRNGYEDIDFCVRLQQKGLRCWVDYRSAIWHHVSSSPGRKDNDLKNQALFLSKWGDITGEWGHADWPRAYLSKILHHPLKLNAGKAWDATLRLLKLRSGQCEWARRMRAEIIASAGLDK